MFQATSAIFHYWVLILKEGGRGSVHWLNILGANVTKKRGSWKHQCQLFRLLACTERSTRPNYTAECFPSVQLSTFISSTTPSHLIPISHNCEHFTPVMQSPTFIPTADLGRSAQEKPSRGRLQISSWHQWTFYRLLLGHGCSLRKRNWRQNKTTTAAACIMLFYSATIRSAKKKTVAHFSRSQAKLRRRLRCPLYPGLEPAKHLVLRSSSTTTLLSPWFITDKFNWRDWRRCCQAWARCQSSVLRRLHLFVFLRPFSKLRMVTN